MYILYRLNFPLVYLFSSVQKEKEESDLDYHLQENIIKHRETDVQDENCLVLFLSVLSP